MIKMMILVKMITFYDEDDEGNDDIKAISTSSSEHYDNTASRKTPLDGIHYDG